MIPAPTFWTPPTPWKGQTAYVIGGGSSIDRFPFEKLDGKNVVGCNYGFRIPAVKWLFFHDQDFYWEQFKALKACPAYLVTCDDTVHLGIASGVATMRKVYDKIGTGHCMGWYGSSGMGATILAARLGASKIYLLGMDASAAPDKTLPRDYHRFLPGWSRMASHFRGQLPGVQLINVSDSSNIPASDIQRMPVSEFMETL